MTINVTNCGDCIFARFGYCHLESELKDTCLIYTLDENNKSFRQDIPENCPLKEQEITVKLNV